MIYLDNASSTPIHPKVLERYHQLLIEHYANQGSAHRLGLAVDHLSNKSKQNILQSFHLDQQKYQVVFTSGASEANNLFLKGVARHYAQRGRKIITSEGEHSSVLKPLLALAESEGFTVVHLPLNEEGKVNVSDLASHLDDETIIVSIMSVNNETGAINDMEAISQLLQKFPKCFFHSDVTQAVAKTNLDYSLFDAFSFSAHKINGLKGSGALIVKKTIAVKPLIEGGNYEYGWRAGTPDSPKNIVLATTLKLAFSNHVSKLEIIRNMSHQLRTYLLNHPLILVNNSDQSLPHIVNFSLKKHKAAIIAAGLSDAGIIVGSSSACSAKSHKPSHVIQAIYHDKHRANAVLRVSFGYFNQANDVDRLIEQLDKLLRNVKYD